VFAHVVLHLELWPQIQCHMTRCGHGQFVDRFKQLELRFNFIKKVCVCDVLVWLGVCYVCRCLEEQFEVRGRHRSTISFMKTCIKWG